MTSDDYINKYGQLESKSVSLSCIICNKDIQRNLYAINKHMEMNHDMDVLAYGTKYRLREYEVTFMGLLGRGEEPLRTHSKKRSYPEESNGLKGLVGPMRKKGKMIEQNIAGPQFITKHLKWYQRSEYQCQMCFEMFFRSEELLQHVENMHSWKGQKYADRYGELQTRSHFYTCQVCDEPVDHSMEAIAG